MQDIMQANAKTECMMEGLAPEAEYSDAGSHVQ